MKKVKQYYSDWHDNGCFIECKNCGAMYLEDCECFELVEDIEDEECK